MEYWPESSARPAERHQLRSRKRQTMHRTTAVPSVHERRRRQEMTFPLSMYVLKPAFPFAPDSRDLQIASSRELENEWHKMIPFFQGKETEHNWSPREKSVLRFRGMLRGQAYHSFPEAFVAGLKSGMMDGLSKTASPTCFDAIADH